MAPRPADEENLEDIEDVDDFDLPPPPTSPTGEDTADNTTNIGVAGYDVMFDYRAISYLGQIIAAVILIVAVSVTAKGLRNSGYGMAVAIVAILFAIVGFYLAVQPSRHDTPTGISLPLLGDMTFGSVTSQFLFVWWFTGAGVLTFNGPFLVTSNGYFACWGGVFCALSTLGVTTDAIRNQAVGLGYANGLIVTCIIQICAVAKYLGSSEDGGAAIYSFVICILTIMGIMGQSHVPSLHPFQFHFYALFTLLWLVLACLVTFRGPFEETGNGYFSAWVALVMCGWMTAAYRT